jgi:hypothetical protein
VKNQQSIIMKNSNKKNRFRSNLGTRNSLGFGDFWSKTDDSKFRKIFFLLMDYISNLETWKFQEESAIMLVFIDIQITNYLILYSSSQKYSNKHILNHELFRFKSFGFKFSGNLYIYLDQFLAKNWKFWLQLYQTGDTYVDSDSQKY